eukprot:gnl/TRDRNA2_/TRDRNA2_181793_c0_seq1.p1 gnl/TRDRNA2_/TRDRNA2_181793_c0~~gnl/TRDRNA2_/TRDRNA2_181793_c0_seq1.p1  ORF type:complete len:380 (+),score=57.40 gnl/TRDRNA2_/TRDRNA2_181793_c0_seq1:50-1189(+)
MGNFVTLCHINHLEDDGFDSNYTVDDHCLGTGKFSTVHLCWRKNMPEKRYALKVLNVLADDFASQNRIKEEISIQQHLGNHPNIITLIDVDDSLPNCIRMVLELCEGGELYDRIQQKQYYSEPEANATIRNLLEAVCYIHSKGIMHRDLKPENILLASKVSNTDIKISDFGLAKMSRDYPRRLPRSHSICGSDFYLAPEVIKQEEYGREIDIWAVGVIAYVLLSGALPFFHAVLHKLYRQIVERDLTFPETVWKSVSKGATDFILRLLQVRAGDRLTAEQSLNHPWLRGAGNISSFAPTPSGRTSFNNSHHEVTQKENTYPIEQSNKMMDYGGNQQQRPNAPQGRPYTAGPPNAYGVPQMAHHGSSSQIRGAPQPQYFR